MKIDVKGAIVPNDDAWIYDWFEIDNTCPKKVADALASAEKDEVIDVEINSGGGSVFAGSEIYTALRTCENEVNIHIVGLAASAASVIAMARNCDMSPTAQIMVHNVSMGCCGDHRDHKHAADILQTANRAVAAAYVSKSGMSEKDALDMMNKETWLTASDALEYGLIDGIIGEDKIENPLDLVASFNSGILPAEVIAKYKERKMKAINTFEELKNREV